MFGVHWLWSQGYVSREVKGIFQFEGGCVVVSSPLSGNGRALPPLNPLPETAEWDGGGCVAALHKDSIIF